MATRLEPIPNGREFARNVIDHYTYPGLFPTHQHGESGEIRSVVLNIVLQWLRAEVSPCPKRGIALVPSARNSIQNKDGAKECFVLPRRQRKFSGERESLTIGRRINC